MNAPDLYDADGDGIPDRRQETRRATDDDDALDSAALLGYEAWAGRVWRHRGKILAVFTLLSWLAGCVAGYLGRANDLNDVRDRLSRVEGVVSEVQKNESLKMSMLCSLTRRIDPLGLPPECGAIQRTRP